MKSKLVEAIALSSSPIAVILTDSRPEAALQFKEGSWGCVAASMLAVSKGKTAVFDRRSYGCPGGGVGLGFGNAYEEKCFAIDRLLSTGDPEAAGQQRAGSHMGEGERFFKDRALGQACADLRACITEADTPDLIVFLANPDQLSALIVMTDFSRGARDPAIAPFGGACQSIIYGYAEAKREVPRGVLGLFDIAQRKRTPRDTLSYTVPWKLFLRMEADVEDSFLRLRDWQELRERQ